LAITQILLLLTGVSDLSDESEGSMQSPVCAGKMVQTNQLLCHYDQHLPPKVVAVGAYIADTTHVRASKGQQSPPFLQSNSQSLINVLIYHKHQP